MPALERIRCRVTQLPNGHGSAFSELCVELDCSNAVFVGVIEIPPGGPSFRPHPQRFGFRSEATVTMKPTVLHDHAGAKCNAVDLLHAGSVGLLNDFILHSAATTT
jgi:hypothetical protein